METQYQTVFGSLQKYEKGRVEPINDDVKCYAFSNVFEICNKSKPYERVVFGINQIYVLEAIRAEGASSWYSCAHDEFALCMDNQVEVHLVKLEQPAVKDSEKNGAIRLEGEPQGKKMGWIKLQTRPSSAAARQLRVSISCRQPRCRRFANVQRRSVDRALGRDLPDPVTAKSTEAIKSIVAPEIYVIDQSEPRCSSASGAIASKSIL